MGDLVKKCSLPFITRYSDIEKMDENIQYVFSLEEKTTDIYNLSLKKSDVCLKERSFSPLKIWFARNPAKIIAISLENSV